MPRKPKQMVFTELLHNLRLGLSLAFFQPVLLRQFRVSLAQVALLVLLDVLLDFLLDYVRAGWGANFNIYGVSHTALAVLLSIVAWSLLALWHKRAPALATLLLLAGAMVPIFYIVDILLVVIGIGGYSNYGWTQFIAWYVLLGWNLAVMFRILRLVLAPTRWRAALATSGYALVAIAPLFLVPQQPLWLPASTVDEEGTPKQRVNAERVFDAQPGLIEQEKNRLLRQRPSQTDVYFVGFGSYAFEDVFMKEVRTIRTLFDGRFDSAGRSVALINNPASVVDTPIASGTNLGKVLQHVGGLMDENDDVLVLYLTSHGSKRHHLSVDFWPLSLDSIGPDRLKEVLDASGIRWKVIIISACYSGGFIEKLRDDYTLVMTSSDAQRESFGCGAGSEFTYFGQALLDVELRRTFSFVDAFHAAVKSIEEREKKERLKPSNPQIAVGSLIEPKLQRLALDLERRVALQKN